MLKGVNHQMIEVTQFSSPYFERAFFVLRADCTDPNTVHLQEEARRVLQAAGGYSALYKNRRRARTVRLLLTVLGMVVGMLLGVLMARIV